MVLFPQEPVSQSSQLADSAGTGGTLARAGLSQAMTGRDNAGAALAVPRAILAKLPWEISATVSAENAGPGYGSCCGARKDWLPRAALDSGAPEDPRRRRREIRTKLHWRDRGDGGSFCKRPGSACDLTEAFLGRVTGIGLRLAEGRRPAGGLSVDTVRLGGAAQAPERLLVRAAR